MFYRIIGILGIIATIVLAYFFMQSVSINTGHLVNFLHELDVARQVSILAIYLMGVFAALWCFSMTIWQCIRLAFK
jgi:hypothetical protein